ncbi:uncharacterized protein LOC124420608 [Lucilia cuprina]|uniref:uncharacterized protein LOC124420608 n=1 Tax=Lucilia cuprina TaxID=7375 RepID=UPI001F052B8C|nr:uncharacterized protein LOC124420608 [Lucilia cuprina]
MADINLHQESHVDLLLGGNIYSQILLEGVKWNHDRSLVAQRTVFGWIITGKSSTPNKSPVASSFYNELNLSHQLSKFWELEEIPEASRMSKDDEYCEEYYLATTYREPSGRFVVSLPFRRNFRIETSLGTSRNIALRQYLRNEAILSRSPNDKAEYDNVVKEYETLGHMTRITDELSVLDNSSYYLPHHAAETRQHHN